MTLGMMLPYETYDEASNTVLIDDLIYQRKQLHQLEIDGIFLFYKKGEGLVGFASVEDEKYIHELDCAKIPTWSFPVNMRLFRKPLYLGDIFKAGKLWKSGKRPTKSWGFMVYYEFYGETDVKTLIMEGGKLQ